MIFHTAAWVILFPNQTNKHNCLCHSSVLKTSSALKCLCYFLAFYNKDSTFHSSPLSLTTQFLLQNVSHSSSQDTEMCYSFAHLLSPQNTCSPFLTGKLLLTSRFSSHTNSTVKSSQLPTMLPLEISPPLFSQHLVHISIMAPAKNIGLAKKIICFFP